MANTHQCAGGCGLQCPNAPERTTPNVVGEYKANAKQYGLSGRWATVQVLAPTRRGANARGTGASKRGWGGSQPKGARQAKRQDVARMGNEPNMRLSPGRPLGTVTSQRERAAINAARAKAQAFANAAA